MGKASSSAEGEAWVYMKEGHDALVKRIIQLEQEQDNRKADHNAVVQRMDNFEKQQERL